VDNLRRFPAPWVVEEDDHGFRIRDASGFFICAVVHRDDLHARHCQQLPQPGGGAAHTHKFESEMQACLLGVGGIVRRNATADCIGISIEQPFGRNIKSLQILYSMMGAATDKVIGKTLSVGIRCSITSDQRILSRIGSVGGFTPSWHHVEG
jgi:hypothetical protein